MPSTQWDLIAALILSVIIAIAIVVIWRKRRSGEGRTPGDSHMGRAREGCYLRAHKRFVAWLANNPAEDAGPEVEFTFHTYSGVLFYCTQFEHRERLPAVAAGFLLRELHWFNLVHGHLALGAYFIAPLSFVNYWSQLLRIRRSQHQFRHSGAAASPGSSNPLPRASDWHSAGTGRAE